MAICFELSLLLPVMLAYSIDTALEESSTDAACSLAADARGCTETTSQNSAHDESAS